jgi:hypothetical protein
MGEYADMAIDDMLALDEYELQYPDEFEPDYPGGVFCRRRKATTKTCNHCGETGLVWFKNDEDKWRLHEYSIEEEEFVQHLC